MQKEKKWELVKNEKAIDLQILTVYYHHYKNPRNDKVVKTISLSGQDSVNVIALTPEKKVILARQFRFGIGDYTLELPGGMIDEGEDSLIAAQRELKEETGFGAANWQYLGYVQSNPVFMDSLVHHYIAENATLKYDLFLDDAEDVQLIQLSIDEVFQKIEDGSIRHPHTISALYFAKELLKAKE